MLRCASNGAMQRVWSRLSLLVLVLFVQLGVARAARSTTPVLAVSSVSAAAEQCVRRWSAASFVAGSAPTSVPCEEQGAPEGDSNSLEQDSPMDDISDTECSLPTLAALQRAGEEPQRSSSGDGMGARHAALDAPFKPPRA